MNIYILIYELFITILLNSLNKKERCDKIVYGKR